MRILLYLSFFAATLLTACSQNTADETESAPADSSLLNSESQAVDTFHNNHMKYDNP